MTTRRFRLNTHLTMPLGLLAAPGAEYLCLRPGTVVEIDAERCRIHDRFLRGRVRAGDMTELEDAPANSSVAARTPTSSPAPALGKA